MRNRLKFVALLAAVCSGAWLCSAALAADAPPSGPQVSKAVAKPLKAAQEALAGRSSTRRWRMCAKRRARRRQDAVRQLRHEHHAVPDLSAEAGHG